ncbi:hypothetical protein FGO68_gene16663 [Halteria grandinella]|uniref:Uncharacterized protein n=1 Tax=Halteria grandinella TaxID=5974 RepID=A0A8J8NAF0_HALGN|nr:hypothetical protein FGO68_gene16663 [Halteria grandinella]
MSLGLQFLFGVLSQFNQLSATLSSSSTTVPKSSLNLSFRFFCFLPFFLLGFNSSVLSPWLVTIITAFFIYDISLIASSVNPDISLSKSNQVSSACKGRVYGNLTLGCSMGNGSPNFLRRKYLKSLTKR